MALTVNGQQSHFSIITEAKSTSSNPNVPTQPSFVSSKHAMTTHGYYGKLLWLMYQCKHISIPIFNPSSPIEFLIINADGKSLSSLILDTRNFNCISSKYSRRHQDSQVCKTTILVVFISSTNSSIRIKPGSITWVSCK